MNTNQSIGLILGVVGAALAILLLFVPTFARWRNLARIYPDCSFVPDHTFDELSGIVAGNLFRGAVVLALGAHGLRLSVVWPFRLFFPAFVVPWAAVSSCRCEPLYFCTNAIRVDLVGESEPVHLRGFLWRHGDAIDTILDYWNARQSNLAEQITPADLREPVTLVSVERLPSAPTGS